jgi:hypothetical protein
MSDDRKKPLWPWIVALLIGLPVSYIASFGPAVWLAGQCHPAQPVVGTVYRPLIRIGLTGHLKKPHPLSKSMSWFACLGLGKEEGVKAMKDCYQSCNGFF